MSCMPGLHYWQSNVVFYFDAVPNAKLGTWIRCKRWPSDTGYYLHK
jgi:hypothetical protein